MLTPNEKNWLEEREKRSVPCILDESWNWCLDICQGLTLPHRAPCPLFPDYRDAAEFEARVAELLANEEWVVSWKYDEDGGMYQRNILKIARLSVEAEMEMEAENDRR